MTLTTTTMTSWTQDRYGPASDIALVERDVPTPGRGEVLLKVHATALNAGDVRIMLGDPLLARPVFGLTHPRNPVRGMDIAGTVVALGDGVSDAGIGDEVVVELPGGGGLAPFAVAPAKRLAARPDGVAAAVAASLPIAGGTAWQALDRARVGEGHRLEGQRVLVLGASGGVGTFAVQLAGLRGAEVHATAAAHNVTLIERLGATRVFERNIDLATLPADGYDAVIDIVGGTPLRTLRRLIRPGGTVVLVAGGGGHVLGPVPRMLRGALLSIGSSRRIRALAASADPRILGQLLQLAAQGAITPAIEREYAFKDAAGALAHVESGHAAGKVVVRAAS
ncbi:NAD(P)-dependent alcohol dehydrogenase [Microbacterium sp. H1-D42]|uniref:NAD(P)-dependent alcohol dehydrogenase n=1 Tax=Microbacterium sp. H1-D42 TaxID=2925844 RepID=UPI001F5371FC|nr:NAD(P)-dependent alcohol dehydrogenase [Microbacterium sp. H1-D42]UNK71330.1 NAD(P)-dependent alcohol dehydrogenase [Microbacterium sp. H1-D42]